MKKLIIILISFLMFFGCSQPTSNIINEKAPIKIELKDDNKDDNAKVKVPTLTEMKNKTTQKYINDFVQNKIINIENSVKNNNEEKYTLDIDSKIEYNKDNLLSISIPYKFSVGDNSGERMDSVNIDASSGMELYLKDMFNNNEDYSSIILKKVLSEVNSNKDNYDMKYYSHIENIKFDQPFYIDEANVVVFFEDYKNGKVKIDEFKIPFNEFKNGVNINPKIKLGVSKILSEQIIENNEFLKINVEYPILQDMKNDNINNKFKEDSKKYIEEIKSVAQNGYDESKKQNSHFNKYELYVDYGVPYNRDNIVSVLQKYYSYTGGAHGITFMQSTTINTKTEKNLELNDLFDKDFDYKTIINDEIKKQMRESMDTLFEDSLSKFKGISDENQFYLTDNAIVFFFQVYDIAPYSSGNVEYKIPFSMFNNNLKISKN